MGLQPRGYGIVLATLIGASLLVPAPGRADVIYRNDFSNPGTAFQDLGVSGSTSGNCDSSCAGGLAVTSLPADSGGIGSANQSNWLGRFGYGTSVTLSLSGLVPSTSYAVGLYLFIGGSWDGTAGFYGPSEWKLSASSGNNSTPLIDATFSNCGVSNQLCGASSPQTYSGANPLAGTGGPVFAPTTGSQFSNDVNGNYGQDYAIYYFGQGNGTPNLSFVAGDSTATLTFQRGPIPPVGPDDEYWALGNISVTGAAAVPEPASIMLFGIGLVGLYRRGCRMKSDAS